MINLYDISTNIIQVSCPYCSGIIPIQTCIEETFDSYDDRVTAVIDDTITCQHCKHSFNFIPTEATLTITNFEISKIPSPAPTFEIGQEIFLKSDRQTYTIIDRTLLYDRVWVYKLSNNKSYTLHPSLLKATPHVGLYEHLTPGSYMIL